MNDKELSRQGHRQRMRRSYIDGAFDSMPDHNLLELYLSLFIVRKDVKGLSYDLINHFGSLSNVLEATPNELMQVKGVGENTAVAISLIRKMNERYLKSRNDGFVINSTADAIEFCKNLLMYQTKETLIVISLDAAGKVINHTIVRQGTVDSINIDIKEVIDKLQLANTSRVIIAHNHLNNNPSPSANDLNFTIKLKAAFKGIGINMLDHIIVSKEGSKSIRESKEFNYIFTKK